MNELQARLLKMLCWLHSYCKEHNLRYYLVHGTMLGAVRHKGFIPWDDDIDVGMPRSDYEKLREICKLSGKEQYVFEFPGDNCEYPYRWAKLFDTTTTQIEKQRYPVRRGINIDIFPLDGIGETYEEALKNFRPIKRCRILNSMISCGLLKRRAWYKNALILLGRIISPLFISKTKLIKKMDDICKQRDYDSYEYVGSLLDEYGEKSLMQKEIYGNPTAIEFEGFMVNGVESPDKYLAALYGEYMKLPPEEERDSHHDKILLDLNNGYID